MLKRIRMELARDTDFPQGSARHGHDFVAPLDAEGRIDGEEFIKHKARCRVLRFWGDDEHEAGHLAHVSGGNWAFRYERKGDIDVDEEAGYRFQSHHFRPGEYVSVREPDGELRTFRVVRVTDAA